MQSLIEAEDPDELSQHMMSLGDCITDLKSWHEATAKMLDTAYFDASTHAHAREASADIIYLENLEVERRLQLPKVTPSTSTRTQHRS